MAEHMHLQGSIGTTSAQSDAQVSTFQACPSLQANIFLVHGAIADGSSWAAVIPLLEAAGHKVLAVQQPLTSLPEDIAKVQIASATFPASVIMVGHSFGGVVITNAAHNEPKVVALVYASAFGPDEGETVIDLGKNYTPLPSNQVFVPDSAGRVHPEPARFHQTKARVMAAVQGPSDGARFAWKLGPPAWKEKPTWCIVSEHDQIIQPELELFCAERMKAKKIVKVPGASHAVMVSHPKVVADTILEAARAVAPKSFTMPGRIHFTVGLIVALSIAVMLPSFQKSRIDSIAPLALGLLLGLLIAETPVASPIQELLGLSSRHPDKVGLDVLHASSAMDAKKAKTELNQKTMYGLQHAFLNLEVTGWWFNMGLWDKSRNMRFQEACRALVDKVTQNLNITSDSHILDVGFGCGDQDVYMAQRYKPARITGVTIESIQHHAAQELIKRSNLSGTIIDLHIADASFLQEFLAKTPGIFESDTRTKLFSHVVSIDSAYHYNTRAQFLNNAFSVLSPGSGHLALADMILAKPAPTSTIGRYIFEAVFGAMEVPVVNMKTIDAYRQDLVDAGFIDIEIECVEDRVFSGLAGFIDGQTSRLGGLVKPGVNWTYWGLSKGLWWLDRSKWLHFVIVRARKP